MPWIYTTATQRDDVFAFAWAVADGSQLTASGQGAVRNASNYRMTLRAVVEALEACPAGPVTVVGARTVDKVIGWTPAWRARGWKKKKGRIGDLDLIKRLADQTDTHMVSFVPADKHDPIGVQVALAATAALDGAVTDVQAPVVQAAPTSSRLVAYTDGGCRGNPGVGGWGFLLIDTVSGTAMTARGGASETTNNRMELMGAIEVLTALKTPGQDIELRTDSVYVRDLATKWVQGWKRRGWVTRDGEPVKNRDLAQQLDDVAAQHRVTWTWVKGHDGEPGNEVADQLTNDAMDDVTAGETGNGRWRHATSPVTVARSPN